jgi:hypothetical protein
MKRALLLCLAIVAIGLFAAAHKLSGPVIVFSEVVTAVSGENTTTTMYTPVDTGIYVVYFRVPAGGCPSPGGAGVLAYDTDGTQRSVGGDFLAEGGQPIQYNIVGPCTVYFVLEQL